MPLTLPTSQLLDGSCQPGTIHGSPHTRQAYPDTRRHIRPNIIPLPGKMVLLMGFRFGMMRHVRESPDLPATALLCRVSSPDSRCSGYDKTRRASAALQSFQPRYSGQKRPTYASLMGYHDRYSGIVQAVAPCPTNPGSLFPLERLFDLTAASNKHLCYRDSTISELFDNRCWGTSG